MPSRRAVTSIVLAAALLLPLGGAVTNASRQVARTVASPADAIPDAAHWRIDVPAGHAVRVRADAGLATAFTLSWCLEGAACSATAPTTQRDIELQAGQKAEWWIVTVDPTLGVAASMQIQFDGFLVDQGGAPADFNIQDLPSDHACFAGACMP